MGGRDRVANPSADAPNECLDCRQRAWRREQRRFRDSPLSPRRASLSCEPMELRSPVQIGGMDLTLAVIHAGIHLISPL